MNPEVQKTGTPRMGNRQAARARAKDLALRKLQYDAFNAYTRGGQTYELIGEAHGINRDTASRYVRDETERRSAEFHDRRQTEIERSMTYLQEARELSAQRMRGDDSHGVHARNVALATRSLNALLGLECATKFTLEPPARVTPEFDQFLQRAKAEADGKDIAKLLQICVDIRSAKCNDERNP